MVDRRFEKIPYDMVHHLNYRLECVNLTQGHGMGHDMGHDMAYAKETFGCLGPGQKTFNEDVGL